jgi:membrane-associated phospholipid phosphatase
MKYHLYNFNLKKNYILIFFTSLVIFLLSCFGVFNSLSADVAKFLYDHLGYTNKWSQTYGEPWFVMLNTNFSAFGSREIVFVFTTFYTIYLFKARGKQKTFNFLFTVIGGILLILTIKYITSGEEPVTSRMVVTENISEFPSGHTFIATVLYVACAISLKSKIHSTDVNGYFLVAALILALIVGLSRIAGAAHTVTEVIAGWSLGICWLTLSQIVLQIKSPTINNFINK